MSDRQQIENQSDPHVDAVMQGLRNKSFGLRRAIAILKTCGYSREEARAAISKAEGGAA